LQQAADLSQSKERGCHIHVLEGEVDRTRTREKYNSDVVERLEQHGILGEKSIAAHGIYLTADGIDRLASTDTMLVHNPQSNMNNAVGRADIFTFLNKNILTGIGTDGMSAD
ncbi:amidohydrolase family protein, partial [candidate division KSB1 bacterium]|nr:amidohydrolase family protein [candidate division KSB1 bacterium]NIS23255.1 amidohydrolase family protein [candidate division KSB1 bacterium]NIT70137.1 amidohydrolase family protein [candidate division KSB1 bacterium]NIU89392.1 amidohydrolase family protein [candidate division KSB1 bacterium]NIW17626.1 amidohydrolase family protein [candidate division KSB1 bacterium]